MRRAIPLLLVLMLVLAACTTEEPASRTAGGPGGGAGALAVDDEPRVMLRPFDSCDALLSYYREHAADLVGPYGLGGGGFGIAEGDVAVEEAAAADSTGGAEVAQGGGGRTDVSGTNVQEVGVDEPDIVKTDGDIIVTSVDGRLRVVDVATGTVVSRIDLPVEAFAGELLLDGDVLLVLSSEDVAFGPVAGAGTATDLFPAFYPSRTVVTRVDLADPANPVVLGAIRMEGSYRSARMIDGTVRIVMVSEPTGLAFAQPTDGGLTAEAEAEERNRQIIAQSDIDDWVPHLQALDADGRPTGEVRRLTDCTAISEPGEFAGLSTLSVLTVDLRGEGIEPTSSAGLVATGDTVYASTDRLVVATSPWGGWVVPFLDRIAAPEDREITTDLHAFDISDPGATAYVASGSVEGTLVNQFALSEVGGVIRVATTTQPSWFGGGSGEDSQSSLVVLAEQGDALVETGRLDGLGITEQIQSVRYLSPDVAAIVTFRQTDPLYLVDTSDPTAPAVLGELEIPGFSSYLHPVADGWLLGVGQDADPATGRTLGLQVSLFDIRDLAAPQRVAQVTFGEGYSPVEYDHRAFLQWTPTGQVVIPAELYPPFPEDGVVDEPYGPTFSGAVVLDVGGFDAAGSLAEAGRVANRDLAPGEYAPGVVRSLVIGDGLWTLTAESLARHDLAGLARGLVVPLG